MRKLKLSALALGAALALGVGAVGVLGAKEALGVSADSTEETVNLASGTFNTDHITWTIAEGNISITQLKGSSSTAVNSSYISGPRVYKGHILSFEGNSSYKISSISITYNSKYYGSSMTAGTAISDNVVTDNTTDVDRTWATTSGGTHVVSSASAEGLTAIHIQNVASSSNVQLRPTEIKVTYVTSGDVPPVVTYSVFFDENGENVTGMPETLTERTGVVSLASVAEPSREGYDFVGWSLTANGETVDSVTVSDADVTVYAIWQEKEEQGDVLYTATFTEVETHSYTQNKEFTLGGKDWIASVSQLSGGVFYLGCNSTHAAKGILNDNETFADVVTALKENDSAYNSNYTTAHAYALLFDNAYENVGEVEFAWVGGNNGFQVYLFGDKGSGYEQLGHTNYATSGQAVAGSVSWKAVAGGESFARFAVVARPGATTSVATSKTLRAGTFTITAGEGGQDAGELLSIEVTGSMTKTAYRSNEEWSADGLVATGHYENTDADITSLVKWTFSPEKPAENVTSVVATASLGEVSGNSAAQAVTVTVAHAGTAEDPFTVAEALAKAAEIGTVGNTGQGPWVTKGIISRVTSAPAATYWNATYYISDDGTQNNELQVYRGFYIDNAKFDENTAQLMKAGNIVVVTGNLTGSYGSEYCQGNYLLSIEEPSTGDIDVTFAPEIVSYEIGATGTFTASTDGANPIYTWGSDKPEVLSVDASTGAFEAKGLGVARITVNVTSDDGEGVAFVDITVNGKNALSVDEAIAIASGLNPGVTTQYYVYVEGFVKEFGTSMSGENPRALDIESETGAKIMVYTNVNPYADFISGLELGDYIKVKANVQNYGGTYELTGPEKIESSYSYFTWSHDFMSQTSAVCEGYDGETDNTDALEAIWGGLKTSYTAHTDVIGDLLLDGDAKEDGNIAEKAMARYEYLVAKYGLENFVARDITLNINYLPSNNTAETTSVMIVVVAAVALVSIASVVTVVVIKRRRMSR